MKLLDKILDTKLSDEEYLSEQRARIKRRFQKFRRQVMEKAQKPEYRQYILSSAQEYMENLYCLPGTGGKKIFVGDPPKWNVRMVDDEEYLWSLNRMPELPILTEAYCITGNEAYAQKALEDLISWIFDCPCPSLESENTEELKKRFNNLVEISPWRLFEMGVRMHTTWRIAYTGLIFSHSMTSERHTMIVQSMYEHALALAKVSPRIWPEANHNHFLCEMLGLLAVSADHSEWCMAPKWRSQAIAELERCCKNQFTLEGGQSEGCPGYHGETLSMLLSEAEIFQENDLEIPGWLKECIDRATIYTSWTIKPTGLMASVGDTSILQGPAKEQAIRYQKLFGGYGHYAEILPLLNYQTCEEKGKAGIKHFRKLGQIVARTGWEKIDSYFMLCCNTPVPNGHSHQDPMNFLLTLNGKDIVTDPGKYTYRECDKRKLYKSPEYHSCLTFGHRPPFEYLTTWRYSEQKAGHTKGVYQDAMLLAGDANHENYFPNEHRRLCAMIGKNLFFVVDDVVNRTRESVELSFHMDSPNWHLKENVVSDGHTIMIIPWQTEARIAQGYKSPAMDIENPTCRVLLTDDNPRETDVYVTIFYEGDPVQNVTVSVVNGIVQISYIRSGQHMKLQWKFAEFCRLIG